MKYSYEDFEADIKLGREVEFIYMNNRYSITNTQEGWQFMKYYDYDTLQVFENEEDLLKNANINSKPLKELWNDISIDIIF
ncbi:hypothetical protein ACI7RC_10740 [Brevibacillus sp. B_LB10_24]|uniref:hypothetical protein n=1 Tax=Brevibacillus sp. B_LB10_24 TaxID=3380645 RepID=UPI0038BD1E44